VHLSVRAERWQTDGLDLLHLGVVSSVEGAGKDQAALVRLVAGRALVADRDESPTRRLVTRLVRAAGRGRQRAGIASFPATIFSRAPLGSAISEMRP
jgi:hypothetical protein